MPITRTFENNTGDISKYHAELLKKIAMEVYKILPRIISEESYKVLGESAYSGISSGADTIISSMPSASLSFQGCFSAILNYWKKIKKNFQNSL